METRVTDPRKRLYPVVRASLTEFATFSFLLTAKAFLTVTARQRVWRRGKPPELPVFCPPGKSKRPGPLMAPIPICRDPRSGLAPTRAARILNAQKQEKQRA